MTARRGLPWHCGSTPAERDRLQRGAEQSWPAATREVWTRAVDVAADRPTTFRRLCQLRVAPYSYDVVDNLGRRSPTELTPGADELEVGQRIATWFTLTAFESGAGMTLRPGAGALRRLTPDLQMTYAVDAAPGGSTRLLGTIELNARHGVLTTAARWLLAWGDLVMMRHQLRRLAVLAARDAARDAPRDAALDQRSDGGHRP